MQPVFNEANLLERVDVWLVYAAEPADLLDPGNVSADLFEEMHVAYTLGLTKGVDGDRTTRKDDPRR